MLRQERTLPFEDAPDAELLARGLIRDYHGHLANARIKYIRRLENWENRGQTVLGQSKKCSKKEKYLTGFDFIITLNGQFWRQMSEQQQRSLVDHELLHCCGTGDEDDPYYIRPHTFEGFAQEIQRNGFWTGNLLTMKKAVDEYRQISFLDRAVGAEGAR